MITLQNLHTHSTYCDGRNTPEETVRRALMLGFDSVGFSEHAPKPFCVNYASMMEKNTQYRAEIARLKEAYRGQIEIFLGLEEEMYAGSDLSHYDYVIGSVHYLLIGGEYVGFECDIGDLLAIIDTHFGGDGMALARVYYETLAHLPEYGRFDVVGHFDVINKRCEKNGLFDMECAEYRSYALEALQALAGKIPLAEINTGAMTRGHRTAPYPAPFLLKEWRARGGNIIISSDCHSNQFLAHYFREAIELAESCGYRETYVLTKDGFSHVSLEDMKRKLI
ncbi:MAG: histidinol-phosphatase HisJ family protein [Clostridia bacterium]|nr:histidinol-phosphatase HisJ family protein [Clostridia bacterium]